MTTEEKYLMARTVFQKKGFRARMQEIADEAGINKAMLHYFKTNNFFGSVHECLQPIVAPNQCFLILMHPF
jgi:hypothetical protein